MAGLIDFFTFKTLSVPLGQGGDTLNIESTNSATATTVSGSAGNDIFSIGSSAGSLAGITGLLVVDGPANDAAPITTLSCGADSHTLPTGNTVIFNDLGDSSTGLVYGIDASTLNRTGMPHDFVTFQNVKTAALNTALGKSTVNVTTTAASVNTSINGNGDDDVVHVTTTGVNSNFSFDTGDGTNLVNLKQTGAGGFTKLTGRAGDDTFFVASNAAVGVAPGLGSLDTIKGVLCVDATGGAAIRLVLDNSTGSTNGNVALSSDTITGLAVGAEPATIHDLLDRRRPRQRPVQHRRHPRRQQRRP